MNAVNRIYKLFKRLSIVLVMGCFVACRQQNERADLSNGPRPFFDKAGMDTSVKAGEDFFLYANGTWMKNTKIPPSLSYWGSFWTIYDENLKKLRQLEENADHQHAPAGSDEQQVGDLYASGMDTASIDRLGYEPVKPLLSAINEAKNSRELLNVAADNYQFGYKLLFNFYVGPDPKNSSHNSVHFDQGRLGLPGADYYWKTDAVSKKITVAYIKYVAGLLTLTGADTSTAKVKAEEIFKLEKRIAQSEFTSEKLRDPVLNYHKFSVTGFQKEMPGIALADIFDRMGLKTDSVIVGQPDYYRTIDQLLKEIPLVTWKDKFKFDVLRQAAPHLSLEFRAADFYFYGKQLEGESAPAERWRDVNSFIDKKLSDPLGKLYAAKYFTEADKKRVLVLVHNIQDRFRERIKKLAWMSPETKKRALEKLAAVTIKVGFPDKWENYRDIKINRKTYYLNILSIARHDYRKTISKINQPVDKSQWVLTVPTADAFYTPVLNDIDFPAGFLQFPIYDRYADDAINYGAVGSLIGHELTHGFDDQGRQFDKDGNLRNWWLPEDVKQFKKRVQVIIQQYNHFTVLNGVHVNGTLSQGEAIADYGGLQIAYEAFKTTPEGKSNVKIDGMTPDQRFFLGFAQQWRIKQSDEEMRLRMNTDPHAPEIARVDVTVSNIPAFYKAFHIKPGEKMYRYSSSRVSVW
jgi:putative endopeptidase